MRHRRLYLKGLGLKEGKKVSDYEIEEAKTLLLVRSMPIYVETMNDRKILLFFFPDDAVSAIKSKIRDMLKIPVSEQQLIFDDIKLRNGVKLSEYFLEGNETLLLSLRHVIYVNTPSGRRLTFFFFQMPQSKVSKTKSRASCLA